MTCWTGGKRKPLKTINGLWFTPSSIWREETLRSKRGQVQFFQKLDLTPFFCPFFCAEKLAELYVATGESVQVAAGKSALLGPPTGRANPILPVIGATVCSERPAFWAPDSGRSWKAGEKVTSQNLS
jgi:hypothetical protein